MRKLRCKTNLFKTENCVAILTSLTMNYYKEIIQNLYYNYLNRFVELFYYNPIRKHNVIGLVFVSIILRWNK